MEQAEFPTKGNLIAAKNSLRLSKQGYDLLDKKKTVLMREMTDLNSRAAELREKICAIFLSAYAALQQANIEMGISMVERISGGTPLEESVSIFVRSIMGVELPSVNYENSVKNKLVYNFNNTTVSLDKTFQKFNDAKDVIIKLAEAENTAYRLAAAIIKTQKRANALQNVTIPKLEKRIVFIQSVLEERSRDEVTRFKMAKRKAVCE
ncbi:MAG: V-type ATP synthase subunit D [Defluviitaleaceae bacterium]|nr:V-type ATP synthase subunit D [Defluviitaleaceae bacterium]